jgi:hypothetical protein
LRKRTSATNLSTSKDASPRSAKARRTERADPSQSCARRTRSRAPNRNGEYRGRSSALGIRPSPVRPSTLAKGCPPSRGRCAKAIARSASRSSSGALAPSLAAARAALMRAIVSGSSRASKIDVHRRSLAEWRGSRECRSPAFDPTLAPRRSLRQRPFRPSFFAPLRASGTARPSASNSAAPGLP